MGMISNADRTTYAVSSLVLAGALLLTGCSPDATGPVGGSATASTDASATATATDASATDASATDAAASSVVTVTDPWAKATDGRMTGAFGILENTSDEDVTLVGAESDLAGRVELHETVDDGSGATEMREVEGGFTIPAGGRLELVPGGNHLMMMDLRGAVAPGDMVQLELAFEDGRVQTLTAPAKDFAGAQEDYGGTGEMGGDMDPDLDHGSD